MAETTDGPEVPRTRFEPPMSSAGEPFWQAGREQRLELPWCADCEQPHWYPRDTCPRCLGDRVEWRRSTGRGVVYAASAMPKPAMPTLADRVPYVVALVDLDDGVRMMSNVVGVDPDLVVVGLEVVAAWEPLSDGRHLLVFEAAAESGSARDASG